MGFLYVYENHSIMEEIWRKVEGFNNYEVSNLNGWRNTERNCTYKPSVKKDGYRYVSLGKKIKQRLYHILVAKAFPEICGEWFEGCEVHHKDFNKQNNIPENLIVLSSNDHRKIHYSNLPNAFRKSSTERSEAISKALKGKKYPEKYKPILQLSKNGTPIKRWESLQSIREELGYSCGNICMCCQGKAKQAYGFLWQYACK